MLRIIRSADWVSKDRFSGHFHMLLGRACRHLDIYCGGSARPQDLRVKDGYYKLIKQQLTELERLD